MKLQQHFWTKTILTACALMGALSTQVARAADAVTVGVLDEAKLGKDYVKYRDELDALNKKAVAFDLQLDAREVLTDAESTKFDALIVNKNRTPAQETEFQALVKTGSDRRLDLKNLSGKAARTPDEEARLKVMQTSMKTNAQVVRRMEDDLFQELKTTEDATNQKYIDMANSMVQKVAIDKKLTVVFRKDAIVWFTPTVDITDEVLKRLNGQ